MVKAAALPTPTWAAGRLLADVTADRRYMGLLQRGAAVHSTRGSRKRGGPNPAAHEFAHAERKAHINSPLALPVELRRGALGRICCAVHGWRRAAAFPCSLQSRLTHTV